MYAELANKMEEIFGLERSPIAISCSTEAPEGVEQMKGRDEDIFVGAPAELLPDIVENLGKLKFA